MRRRSSGLRRPAVLLSRIFVPVPSGRGASQGHPGGGCGCVELTRALLRQEAIRVDETANPTYNHPSGRVSVGGAGPELEPESGPESGPEPDPAWTEMYSAQHSRPYMYWANRTTGERTWTSRRAQVAAPRHKPVLGRMLLYCLNNETNRQQRRAALTQHSLDLKYSTGSGI